MKSDLHSRSLRLYSVALVALIFIIYLQTVSYDFVHYDDNAYVFSNAHVAEGLSAESIRWAVTSTENSLWLPLTRLSYLIDASIAGISPGWYHFVNVLLYCISTVLLLYVLTAMTGAVGLSAVALALFACHPLRVESVVWVTERKDMLSMCLLAVSLLLYVKSVRKHNKRMYIGSVICYAGSLMAKPMAVMMPFLLLVIDWWPLERYGRFVSEPAKKKKSNRTMKQAVIEKLPYLGIAGVISLVTIISNRGALKAGDMVTLPLRLANAPVSVIRYLANIIWPSGLTFYYPFDSGILTPVTVGGSLAIIIGVMVALYLFRREMPYLFAGWIWFCVALLPVIGIVQAGSQSMADRFTYLPMLGVAVVVSWGGAMASSKLNIPATATKAVLVVVIAALVTVSFFQTRTWRNSDALFTHARAVTTDNYIATLNLANLHLSRGDAEAAEPLYRETLRIRPDSGAAHVNLANILIRQGNYEEALGHLNMALADTPENPMVYRALAETLARLGRTDEAEQYLNMYQQLMRRMGR